MVSEERLSTRDIAGGGDTATDRDETLADTPPADTAAVPPDRADRDYDDGDVVTDEPTGRGPSRESIADPAAGDTAGDEAADRPAPAAAAAAAAGDTPGGDTRGGGGPRPPPPAHPPPGPPP